MGTQVECHNCGAGMRFNPETRGLLCDHCGSKRIIAYDNRQAEERDLESAPVTKVHDPGIQTFQCGSCGAMISTGRNITGECPFCGSEFVKELQQGDDIISPTHVIPFGVSPYRAKELFRTWVGKGYFRPNDLMKIKRLDKIKGIYAPFWTYDCSTHADWAAESGYYYWETETYTAYVNGKHVTRTRQVRKTRWVPSRGQRDDRFDDILVLASRGINEDMAEKVYPFHLDALVTYKPEFLSGWMAEEYSIGIHEGWGKAMSKVKMMVRQRCGGDVPGDTYRSLNVRTTFSDRKYKHILLPIWSASYHYRKKLYHFLINGQTGEVQGEKPISWIKIAIAVAAGLAAAGLVLFLYLNLS
ncbi:MAG: hypothetical protein JW939_03820 [Candidatus Thermoplasmatota archaeon]|nr:hypothetical protein [Candidatus Thermoplasmatota archaeon]